jgi:lipopolysaccharide biosynthesis protein
MNAQIRRARSRFGELLFKIQRRLGYTPSQPRGRERLAAEEFSIEVPFPYEASPTTDGPIAVVCHLFHAELAGWLIAILRKSNISADIFISTETEEKRCEIKNVLDQWLGGRVDIRVVENRGRDIAPKLVTFADIYKSYKLVLFLHSKRSGHFSFGDTWRDYLVECLAGSPAIVGSIHEIFKTQPNIGMVIPPHYPALRAAVDGFHWGANFRKARDLASRMGINLDENGILDFPSGSMFWARPEALKPLLDLQLAMADFPKEPCGIDGTLAHSIERLLLFSCEKAGFKWMKVLSNVVASPDQPRVIIHKQSQIDDFISDHCFDLIGDQVR